MIRTTFSTIFAAIMALTALTSCETPTVPPQPEGLTPVSTGSSRPTSATRGLGKPPYVNAAAYIVVDPRDGEILLQHNAHTKRAVASTQKLLTALVLLETGGMDRTVTVAASDTYVAPTKMGLKAGERYTRRHLLNAMVVRSSNDIAACLARTSAGSEKAFVQRMNAKAQQIGMRNSRFANAHGLTASGQYSTAFDVAILATHALANSQLHRMTQMREFTFKFPDGRVKPITNTNKVLRMSPYCIGMKTGYTNPAGRCLVSAGQRGSKKVICVVLGSQVPDIWEDSRDLLHWALEVPTVSG